MKKSIKIQNISKSFPGVKANSNVSFDIDSGSIHAVVGENGAGKSTLMKILYGMIKPDSGDMYVFDEKISLNSPKDAIKYGLGMVHQHFMLADNFTVLESIILGIDSPGIANLKLEKYKDSLQEVMKRYSLNVDLDQYVDDLGVGEKQRVEILKVLFRGAKILILDEPTAVLVPQEVDELFKNLKDLQNNGVTIIFISHKLDEVIKIADQITVMRGGEIIGTVDADQVNKKQLAEMMIGKSLPKPPERSVESGLENVLKVENLNARNDDGKTVFENISFEIKKSEILGIAGVEGNGQKELIESIIGIQEVDSGDIYLENSILNKLEIRQRLDFGISFIPEDRQAQALVMEMKLNDNIILGRQSKEKYKTNVSTVNLKNAGKISRQVINDFNVKTPNETTIATALSGGNQQKFVVGRELDDDPKVLIASQPTRGIDIGAQALIWDKLRETRDSGLGVLLISADLEELIGLSDRIIVIYQGKFVAELDPNTITPEELGAYMTGLKQ